MKTVHNVIGRAAYVLLMGVACGGARAAETAYSWNGGTSWTAPTNAADWNVAANWNSSASTAPNDAEAYATLASGAYYVTSGVPVSVSRIDCGSGTSLDNFYVSDSELTLCGRNKLTKGLSIYAPVRCSAGGGTYAGYLNLCGDVVVDDNCYLLANGATVNFRYDLFANAHDLSRTAVELGKVQSGTGASIYFYMPRSTKEDFQCPCDQTEGSPYVYVNVGAFATRDVAVGAEVVGSGVEAGTFVRRIFNARWVELSRPAVSTLQANRLTFKAFAPRFRQKIASLSPNGSVNSCSFFFNKYQSDDFAEIEIASLGLYADSAKPNDRAVTLTCSGTAYPATVVIHNTTTADGTILRLNKADILFSDSTAYRGPGLPYATVSMLNANSEARLSVTGDMVAVIRSFTNIVGSVTKTGSGTLKVGMGAFHNSGTLVVEEGTYAVADELDSAGASIGSLQVAGAAAFKVPLQGFTVGGVAFATGAILDVPVTEHGGVVPMTVSGTASLASGGVVRFAGDPLGLERGDHVLIAGGVAAGVSEWSLSDGSLLDRRYVRILSVNGNLVLRYGKKGLVVSIK